MPRIVDLTRPPRAHGPEPVVPEAVSFHKDLTVLALAACEVYLNPERPWALPLAAAALAWGWARRAFRSRAAAGPPETPSGPPAWPARGRPGAQEAGAAPQNPDR